MADESSELANALDQIQIFNVRRAWAFSLDLGEWDRLRSCFHPDARLTVSWYSGPLDGFIDRSRALMASRKPEEIASIGSAICAARSMERAPCWKLTCLS